MNTDKNENLVEDNRKNDLDDQESHGNSAKILNRSNENKSSRS